MLHFVIEEDEPVIYLAVKDQQLRDSRDAYEAVICVVGKWSRGTYHDRHRGHLRNERLLAKDENIEI